MTMETVQISVCSSEQESWDTVWKWTWFLKETWISNFREEINVPALHLLFEKLRVKSILDCSCGLGKKTVCFAEICNDVEGSDASAVAIRYAPQLAKEKGFNINFFQSRWEELSKKCKHKFDCVFSDAFDWITTRESLLASAKGIFSVLEEGGKFVFGVPLAGSKNAKVELQKFMDNVWKKQGRFEILPPYEKDGIELTVVYVYDKVQYGIHENCICLVQEKDNVRAEIASYIDLYKWTWKDYTKVLRKAGFKKVYGLEEKGIGFNVAVK